MLTFVRGDMYLRDLSHTKGHTMEVSCVAWHPKEKNLVMTAGFDGTLRLWDITGVRVLNYLSCFGCMQSGFKNFIYDMIFFIYIYFILY